MSRDSEKGWSPTTSFRAQERDLENLRAIRKAMSPLAPEAIRMADVIRYAIDQTARTIAGTKSSN